MKRTLRLLASLAAAVWMSPCATADDAAGLLRVAVDPEGETAGEMPFADLDVFTRGLTTDLYAADFETNGTVSSLPVHLGRRPGHPAFFGFRDSSLPPSGGRVYLVADATRDADRDGLPDEMERRIYGTSPYLADTDGDGVSDAFELAWGSDPLLPDAEPPQLLFAESFERPEIVPGPVAGQRDWRACGVSGGAADALVQEDVVFDGFAALEVLGGRENRLSTLCGTTDISSFP